MGVKKKVFDDTAEALKWIEANCVNCSNVGTCENYEEVSDSAVSLQLDSNTISEIGETASGDDWAELKEVCDLGIIPKSLLIHNTDITGRTEPDCHPAEAISVFSTDLTTVLKQFNYCDFLYPLIYTFAPWYGQFLALGTLSTASVGNYLDKNHVGITSLVSHATNANSGYWITTTLASHILGGKEKTKFIFMVNDISGTSIILGFADGIYGGIIEGVYFKIINGVLSGETKNTAIAGTSTTATNYTLLVNTWYVAELEINTEATEVLFTVKYKTTGSILWQDTITTETNIPKTAWGYLGHGLSAIKNAPSAANPVMMIDYMDLLIDRVLDR